DMLLELIDDLPFARGRLTSVVRQATDVHTQSHSALAVKQILVLIRFPQTISIDGGHHPVLEIRLLMSQVQARTHLSCARPAAWLPAPRLPEVFHSAVTWPAHARRSDPSYGPRLTCAARQRLAPDAESCPPPRWH